MTSKRVAVRIPSAILLMIILLIMSSGSAFAKKNATDYEWTKGPYTGQAAVVTTGKDSPAQISIGLPNEADNRNILEFTVDKPIINNNVVKGITYDLAANTLTLDHFQNSGAAIHAYMMGDDFTIRVIGDCRIQELEVSTGEYLGTKGEPLYWGGSLNITGAGTLTVNNTSQNFDLWGITLWGEGSDARLNISPGVSLNVYGHVNSPGATRENYFSTPYAIMIIRTAGFYDYEAITVDSKPISQVYPKYKVNGFMNESSPTLKDYWVDSSEVIIKGSGPVNLTSANVTLSAASFVYNEEVRKPEILLNGKDILQEGVDYTAVWSNDSPKNAGTYTLTITGRGDYTGTKKLSFKIVKAANPLSLKGLTATVKHSRLKKKVQKLPVSRVLSFAKKGKGKMSFIKVSGNKKIEINKKTGRVTIRKGLKKGIYKVKVKVKAAGNSNYRASAAKTLTFRIKIK